MVLSIEVDNFASSLRPQGVQELVPWVVHHLGQSPQAVGNVPSSELLCIGHCTTKDQSVKLLGDKDEETWMHGHWRCEKVKMHALEARENPGASWPPIVRCLAHS